MMRKLDICLVVLATIIGTAESSAQFRYGPTLGVDVTDLIFKQDIFTVEKSTGFSAGVAAEYMFPGIGFGIDTGLFYTQRGAKLNLGEKYIWSSEGYGNERSYLHYFEIPFHLRFKYTNLGGLEDYVAPYVFGGPSFNLLFAHNNLDALEYAKGEIGMTAGFGLELWKRWQIQGSYTWGVVYSVKTALLDNHSAKNRTMKVSLVYLF